MNDRCGLGWALLGTAWAFITITVLAGAEVAHRIVRGREN